MAQFPTFTINNNTEKNAVNALFKVGIPCRQGAIFSTTPLRIESAQTVLPASIQHRSLWPDGSVKWLFIEGLASVEANSSLPCKIALCEPVSRDYKPVVNNSDSTLDIYVHQLSCQSHPNPIDNGETVAPFTLSINKTRLLCFDVDESNVKSEGVLINGLPCEPLSPIECRYVVRYSKNTPLFVDVTQSSTISHAGAPLNIEVSLTVCVVSFNITCTVSIQNPLPAQHHNGLWDLGDPNSQCFQDIALSLSTGDIDLKLSTGTNCQSHHFALDDTFILYQASSGKPNWQSPTHLNADNTIDLPFKGFSLEVNQHLTEQGLQCEPQIWLCNKADKQPPISIAIEHFWQNFPASIEKKAGQLRIGLLGAAKGPITELQPGEQKTRSLCIGVNQQVPLSAVLCPEETELTQAIPFFHSEISQSPFHPLVQLGVDGEKSFYKKREAIDEYGWRHFGELFADHETVLEPDTPIFVSHYNNQYDPIYGMLTQWLLTGNYRWFELADALTKHVVDIDIYHTTLDKPDYSGGLFWHTDHYVQAFTATHRTYSAHQPSNVYDDHAGGGGPGGQHCYSSGLLLHYYLTGYAPSKNAILSLGTWIQHIYENDRTVSGLLLSVKNRYRADLKNVFNGTYPLDRGTGNYIQTMLDCFQLTSDPYYLSRVEHIIYHTISPDEELAERNLDNVESTWFYTVLLQSVCRFLIVKTQQNQKDNSFYYALESLLHYARWMAENENTYLSNPDILEFPNETWSGQDLRKVCILSFAMPFLAGEWQTKARNTLLHIAEEIQTRLSNSNEKDNTRVLSLMMQNYTVPFFSPI